VYYYHSMSDRQIQLSFSERLTLNCHVIIGFRDGAEVIYQLRELDVSANGGSNAACPKGRSQEVDTWQQLPVVL